MARKRGDFQCGLQGVDPESRPEREENSNVASKREDDIFKMARKRGGFHSGQQRAHDIFKMAGKRGEF